MKSASRHSVRARAFVLWALSSVVSFAALQSPAQDAPRVVHVFVALADNQYQGIVPVPARIGNGDDPDHNLYWGSGGGVKTYFRHAQEWTLLSSGQRPKNEILERCVFKHKEKNVYLIADAYRGREIRQAIVDFLYAAAGRSVETVAIPVGNSTVVVPAQGAASLVAYIGHDGLMDFQLTKLPKKKNDVQRDVIILACISKAYFANAVRESGANPLLWTTGLMAPEAYTLKSALDGWIAGENANQIHERAATAYDRYQRCGLRFARKLFASGW